MLPRAADAGGRVEQRPALPASEGQARQPLERVVRGGVLGRDRRDGGRARCGRQDDHGHGHAYPPRLRRRQCGNHAGRARGSRASHAPSQRLWRAAFRPAADAACACRHGARRCRRHRTRAPPCTLVRRSRARSRRGCLCTIDDPGGQVLGLQDRAGPRLRGNGVPWRQRLCRGRPACPLLPRSARQRDLGRLGQCDGARRAAGAETRPAAFRRRDERDRPRSGAGRQGNGGRAARSGRSRLQQPNGGASVRARSPTPSWNRAWPDSGARPTACSTPATTRARSSIRSTPSSTERRSPARPAW